jgi:molybdopterin molybdotransferase
MKPFFEVQTLEAVWERVRGTRALEAENVALAAAEGRTLASVFAAPHDLPGFVRSTMDGYAVRAQDTFGATETQPGYLVFQSEVEMGRKPDFALDHGSCARIGTGGMLPDGADAVIMVEHTREADNDTVEISRSVAPGSNVIGAADDAVAGQSLLPAGRWLRPQDLGLLAALGVLEPEVVRKPRAGIISTGDEVVPVERVPGPGEVRDVNATVLAAQVQAAGADAVDLGLVPDDPTRLKQAVATSLEENDLTLLSGGSSMGVRDLTAEIFLAFPGAELVVHGVSVAPGKPFIWVRAGDHQLLGLPGQVTSCLVAFHLFVEPLLERLLGREGEAFTRFGRLDAILDRRIPSAAGRELFQRVRVDRTDGGWRAEPVLGRSGLLRSLVQGHGLVRVPLGSEGLDVGTRVEVLLFPGDNP